MSYGSHASPSRQAIDETRPGTGSSLTKSVYTDSQLTKPAAGGPLMDRMWVGAAMETLATAYTGPIERTAARSMAMCQPMCRPVDPCPGLLSRYGFHLSPVVRNLLSREPSKASPCGLQRARLSPFSLPVLHTGSTVRPRTRLLGLACRLPTSAAGLAPPSRALPAMPRRTFLLFILRASYRTRVASAAEFCGPETMCGRPAYMAMSEHVNFRRTYPFF